MSFVRRRKKNGRIYLEEVENVRIKGKVVQKHIRYIGKEADKKTILSSSISNISIEHVKLYGPLLVLNHICKEINLSNILGEYGDEILSLVFAHCMDYKSINKMSRWFERTDLNMLLNLEGLTEDRLLRALDYIETKDLEKLQRDIFTSVNNYYQLDRKGIIYDVTNVYLYGKKCSLGKLGKDKSGVKGRPLIQIGLGVTQKEGVPLFHKTFDGNVSDSRTLHDLISSFKQYDIKSGLIIYDRGITSSKNIRDVKGLRWDTICGVACNQNLKKIVKKLVSEKNLININRRVRLNKTIFYVYSQKYEIETIKGTLLICYNEQQKKDLRESRYDEISNAQKLLKESKSIKPGLEKYFHKNGNLNHKTIAQAEEFDGFSFIFSTKRLSTREIIRLYFEDKDIVEKAFQSLKGVIKLRPIRHWLYNRVIAHIFFCYLSYLLLSLLKLRLKKIGISPLQALNELETLYKVYIRDNEKGFRLSRTVTLTKIQEKILKTINKSLLSYCSG
ncbi:MAG: IS1634 family transposase [Candidatus Nanoarchaeia archaeon]